MTVATSVELPSSSRRSRHARSRRDARGEIRRVTLPHASVAHARSAALDELDGTRGECLLIPVEPMTLALASESGGAVEHRLRAYSVSWFEPSGVRRAGEDDAEFLLVRIDPDWFAAMCRRINAAFERPPGPVMDAVHVDIPMLGAAITRLLASADGSHETFLPPMLDWLVSRCAAELGGCARRGEHRAAALGEVELHATLREIERRLPDAVPVAELAASLGMSDSRFSRAFKASVGCPPSRYVLERRLSRARGLLERSEMSLIEVTFASGFSSQSHMTFVFVKELGVTPGQYRSSCARPDR